MFPLLKTASISPGEPQTEKLTSLNVTSTSPSTIDTSIKSLAEISYDEKGTSTIMKGQRPKKFVFFSETPVTFILPVCPFVSTSTLPSKVASQVSLAKPLSDNMPVKLLLTVTP